MTFEDLGIRCDRIFAEIGLMQEWERLINSHGTATDLDKIRSDGIWRDGRLTPTFQAQLADLRARAAG
jgi:pantothenate kinase type III